MEKSISILHALVFLGFIIAFYSIRAHAGGADTGGGNTVNGIIIENFQMATYELEGWNLVEEKIELIKNDIPLFGAELEKRSDELRWYILPTKFEELPSSITQIGVSTDQMAIHKNGEVYLDGDRWNDPQMSADKKAALILHEIVLKEYFKIKNDNSHKYPGLQRRLSMSDMRRISKLVVSYQSNDMVELQKELSLRNYGYYVSRNIAEKYLNFVDATIRQTAAIYCEGERTPLISGLSVALSKLNIVFFNSPVPYGGRAKVDEKTPIGTQRLFQKQDNLMTPLFLIWASLVENYFSKNFLMLPTKYNLHGESFFDQAYPGKSGTQWDLDEGRATCERLESFHIDNFEFNFRA